jgi:hypothetical protein
MTRAKIRRVLIAVTETKSRTCIDLFVQAFSQTLNKLS